MQKSMSDSKARFGHGIIRTIRKACARRRVVGKKIKTAVEEGNDSLRIDKTCGNVRS